MIVVLRDDDVGALLPAELADLVHDSAQDLVVQLRRIDRVVGPGSVGVIRGVRLLRPKDGESRLLLRQNVIDEDVSQIREPTPRKSPSAVERIRGLPIVELRNGYGGRRVTVVMGERQSTSIVGVERVPRQGIPSLL